LTSIVSFCGSQRFVGININRNSIVAETDYGDVHVPTRCGPGHPFLLLPAVADDVSIITVAD
jgi:hypothetical protein